MPKLVAISCGMVALPGKANLLAHMTEVQLIQIFAAVDEDGKGWELDKQRGQWIPLPDNFAERPVMVQGDGTGHH